MDIIARDWLEFSHTKRPGSIARDSSILDNHILPILGSTKIGSVTRREVQRLVNDLSGRFSPSTTLRIYGCLRALLSYAETCELIARSPCRNIRLPEVSPRKAQILNEKALTALLKAWGRPPPCFCDSWPPMGRSGRPASARCRFSARYGHCGMATHPRDKGPYDRARTKDARGVRTLSGARVDHEHAR
jgi:hypothetical protein